MSKLKAYVACLLIFCTIDFLWLGIIAKDWYHRELGHLFVESVNWAPAISFYLLYTAGILVFAVYPSIKLGSWKHALFHGAFLGLISYAAYDLTNLATLKNWPILLSLCDLSWGAFVTGVTSFTVFKLKGHLFK